LIISFLVTRLSRRLVNLISNIKGVNVSALNEGVCFFEVNS